MATIKRAGVPQNQAGLANPIQFSPNYKLVKVAQTMGVRDLSKMQITTRQIYHAIKLQASTQNQTITFFQNVNTTNFPFTNLTENKLQAGEAIAVERAYLSILAVDNTTPANPKVVDVLPAEFLQITKPLLRGDFDLQIDRQTVTKKINTTSWYAPFNKDANFGANVLEPVATVFYATGQSVYHFDNSFVIIPQIEFTATLTIPPINPAYLPGIDLYCMLNLEGLGCLFNPKANY